MPVQMVAVISPCALHCGLICLQNTMLRIPKYRHQYQPTVLDVWNFRTKGKLIEAGCIKMSDLTEEDVVPKPDKRPGISAGERQWPQVEKMKIGKTF